jgi:hypothetical protein
MYGECDNLALKRGSEGELCQGRGQQYARDAIMNLIASMQEEHKLQQSSIWQAAPSTRFL